MPPQRYILLILALVAAPAALPLAGGCATSLPVAPSLSFVTAPDPLGGAGGIPSQTPLGPPRLLVGDYSAQAWPGWENVTYFPWSPKVDYQRVAVAGGEPLVRAVSEDAGSMWMRRVTFSPTATPIVSWRWKVPGPIANANELANATDDAAARVYFVWGLRDRGDLFRSEALGYVWGRTRRPGTIGAAPFSPKIGIVCLRAGTAGANEWQEERRDLAADFRAYFKKEPPGPVTAIALLTDTDNTNGQAVAWYGQVYAEARQAK